MADETALATGATELLRTLIRNACVNDGSAASGHEVRSVAALEDFFAGSGLALERHESLPGRGSLIARIEGRDRQAPTLLLMGHTDVVPVNPAGWQRDPFAAELVDGIVWGRGAIDMLKPALPAHPVHGIPAHVPRPRRAGGRRQPAAVGDDVGGARPRVPRLIERPRAAQPSRARASAFRRSVSAIARARSRTTSARL